MLTLDQKSKFVPVGKCRTSLKTRHASKRARCFLLTRSHHNIVRVFAVAGVRCARIKPVRTLIIDVYAVESAQYIDHFVILAPNCSRGGLAPLLLELCGRVCDQITHGAHRVDDWTRI